MGNDFSEWAAEQVATRFTYERPYDDYVKDKDGLLLQFRDPSSKYFLDEDAKLLAKHAAEVIRIHGWCQDIGYDEATGQYCLVGAVVKAAIGRDLGKDQQNCHVPGTFKVYHALETLTEKSLPDWNDTHGRTKEQVLRLLDRVASL